MKNQILISALTGMILTALSHGVLAKAASSQSNIKGYRAGAIFKKIGIIPSERFVSGLEVATTLESVFCKKVDSSAVSADQDIGVIFKANTSGADIEIEDIFERSERTRKTAMATSLAEGNRSGAQYYRCLSVEQLIKEHAGKMSYNKSLLLGSTEIEKKIVTDLNSSDFVNNENIHLRIQRQAQMNSRKLSMIADSSNIYEKLNAAVVASRYYSIALQMAAMGGAEFLNLIGPIVKNRMTDMFDVMISASISDEKDKLFKKVRDHFSEIYGPIVKKVRNVPLEVGLSIEYPEYMGGVSLYKDKAGIELGYDLHQFTDIAPDAYTAILCHEAGHLLAGTPYSKSGKSDHWYSDIPSSSEAQSDYFSSLVCMKEVFASSTSDHDMSFNISQNLRDQCFHQYSNTKDRNICQRSIQAGLQLMGVIRSIYKKNGARESELPILDMDKSEGAGLSVGALYPSIQCRFDTIKAGALDQERPACWFQR